ncbi:MAG: enoyl-CoA hydratase [Gammaproteobacteria bacterium]|nr:enoyl-CoA hydratase [Gammaproteobacteria bacterium]
MTESIDTGTDELLCELDGAVATVTLNRPEKRNALSNNLTPALRAILLTLEADTRVRCVMITGAGNAFCAGGDISGMGGATGGGRDAHQDDRPAPSIEDAVRNLQHGQETLTLRLHQLAKPTLAALPGPAAGAGLSIALACDMRVASESAFITTAYRNIGFSGDYGGSWLLTRLVGPGKAKELYFTAERLSADECRALGIVNQVFPDDTFRAQAHAFAQKIASGPPIAMRYMKENINRAITADLKTCLDMEADRMIRTGRTEDHREAVAAFLNKSEPQFKGR